MMNGPDDFIGPVNIGNPFEFNILELAEKILKMTGSQSKIVFAPLPQDDPQQRQPDISLAFEKLNWKPAVELDEGLEKTIAYFKDIL
jgi:UDP-glucuronate decarboxylase